MRYIDSGSHDPYYNLALEEYVLLNFKDDDYLLLYNSDKSIVVGKYQNVFEEVNLLEVERQKIPILRRISGGGTVYHDRNNLNYSMIMEYSRTRLSGYDTFLLPMIQALNNLGIMASKRRTCDIAIGDFKISGSAQTIKKDRILHHGTLLFDSDLEHLHELLKTTDGIIKSNAVKSYRSNVTNIKNHLSQKSMSLDAFKELLLKEFFPEGIRQRVLQDDDLMNIRKLADGKYRKWTWNYGASPKFTFRKEGVIRNSHFSVFLDVREGIVTRCELEGAFQKNVPYDLIGIRYDYEDIRKTLLLSEKCRGTEVSLDELLGFFF